MERMGQITAVHGDLLEVTICRPTDCEKCNGCSGAQKAVTLEFKGSAKVGDAVVVEMPTGSVIKASFLAYTLPLLTLIAGMLLGSALVAGDMGALVGAIVGLVAGLLILFFTEKQRKNDPAWKPKLKEIIPAMPAMKGE